MKGIGLSEWLAVVGYILATSVLGLLIWSLEGSLAWTALFIAPVLLAATLYRRWVYLTMFLWGNLVAGFLVGGQEDSLGAGVQGQILFSVMTLVLVELFHWVTLREGESGQKLRYHQEHLNACFESAPFAYLLLDSKGRILRFNRTASLLLGANEWRVGSAGFFEVLHPEERAKFQQEWVPFVRQHGVSLKKRLRIRTELGQLKVLEVNLANELGDPQLQAVLMQCRDITEQTKAEESLRQNEALLIQVMDTLPVGVWVLDRAGSVIIGNPAGRRIWGVEESEKPPEFSDIKVWRHYSGEKLGPEDWAFRKALKEKETTLNETLDIEDFKGNKKTLLNSAVPILDGNGQVLGTIAVNQDITDRLELETQLRKAQKMESIGQLAAGIAHDFNNIMTVIQGRASLLMATLSAGSPLIGSLQAISQAADRAAHLTRQLLTFSRNQATQPKVLDLNRVLEQTSDVLDRTLGEDIQLDLRLQEKLPPVYADGGMLEQVLFNLAVNARDAMPGGGVLRVETGSLTVDAAYADHHAEARQGEFIRIRVADTGQGMDATTKSRLFEPFFTTKEAGKGTGLGLSTVYGIIKQHRGWITVESELDRGTVFEIYLPVSKSEVSSEFKPPSGAEAEKVLGGDETILMVEDEPALRGLVRHILQSYGYHVLEATSGREALQVWEKHRDQIDLVLTDLVMPEGISGWKLAQLLQEQDPSVRILFTSGHSRGTAGQQEHLQPGVNFLPKPYMPPTLARMVRTCLDEPRTKRGNLSSHQGYTSS